MAKVKNYERAYMSFADLSQTFVWTLFGAFIFTIGFHGLVLHELLIKTQPGLFWLTFLLMSVPFQLVLWVPYARHERERARYLASLTPAETPAPRQSDHQPGTLRRVDGKIVRVPR